VKAPLEGLTVRAVAVTDQIFGRAVPWERLGDLARNPFGGGMRRDIDRDDQPSVDGDNDQGKEYAQIDRRNYKKIERGNTLGVIAEKGLPTLRRRPVLIGHALGTVVCPTSKPNFKSSP
jgi:hypothetical protein